MSFAHDYLFPAIWLIYSAYWWFMSKNVKQTQHRESGISGLIRLIALILAAALLWLPRLPGSLLNERFLPPGEWCFWTGAAVTVAGLLFSVWGRRYLGTNWSQDVTVKVDHELITSGPYALVRHPIYAGLLLGFLGCAVARGEWRGLLAVALVFSVLWYKLKLEEKLMRAQFGLSYEAYSRRVSALVPYLL
jgi:protein-S-isoprenylcysteine O-methyltransferase Ste14